MTSRAAFIIAAASVLMTAALATAPHAQAASRAIGQTPITVYQIPASGLQIDGRVPGLLFLGVTARSAGDRGDVVFAAPATARTCRSSAASTLFEIRIVNVADRTSGTLRIAPCPNGTAGAPGSMEIHTGTGRIAVATRILGSEFSPYAGQPSLPGIGTFRVAA